MVSLPPPVCRPAPGELAPNYPTRRNCRFAPQRGCLFEQNGYTSEAFHHAQAAGDIDSLARLIEQNADAMMTLWRSCSTLIRWTEALPDEVIRRHPLILIAKAWMLNLAGAVQQVVHLLLQQVELQLSGWRRNARLT